MTNVFIDDHVNTERYDVVLSQSILYLVESNWCNKDSLLVDLHGTDMFKDRSTWSSLKPLHYNLLILRNFIHLDRIKPHQRVDITHPAVKSLHFLLGALSKCIMTYSDTKVLMLKITRIKTDLINFDYTSTIWLEIQPKSNEHELKLVVDNTRTE